MTTITEIREAIAASLEKLPGVQTFTYLKGNPTLPAVMVFPNAGEYHQAMHDGFSRLVFTVQGFAALGLDQAAQATLDSMLAPTGETSVKAAVETDITLGGLVASCYVSGWSNYSLVTLQDNVQAMRVDWTVEVYL